MIIKFNASSLPSQAIIDQIQLRNVELSPAVFGWYTTDSNGNDILTVEGDYFIIQDATHYRIIRRVDYLASPMLQRIVTEEIVIQLLEDIVDAFNSLPISDVNKLSILNTTGATMTAIVANKLTFALAIFTATATTANFTAGVKTAGLNLISAAIAKL
jgi:hypothetical protein